MRLLVVVFALVALTSARWSHRYERGPQRERSLEDGDDYRRKFSEDLDQTEQDDDDVDDDDDDQESDDKESDDGESDQEDSNVQKRYRNRHHHPHRYEKRRQENRRHYGRRPWFCKKSKCPPFKTVRKYRGFELRCYRNATYVVTKADKVDQKDFKPMFKRLFDYIRGANAANATFKMTVPVLVGMVYNISTHKTKSAMSFYLPYSSPPAPSNEKVSLYSARAFCAYVRPFFGRVRGRDRRLYWELYILSKAIRRYKKDYKKGLSIYAGYSSPWDRLPYNEVWRIPARQRSTLNDVPEFIPTSTWDIEYAPEEEVQNGELLSKEGPGDDEDDQLAKNQEKPQGEFEEERFALVTP